MRDYKNVKVPRSYKTHRVSVKRVDAGRSAGRAGKKASGLRSVVLNVLLCVLLAGLGLAGWEGYRLLTHADMFVIAGVDVQGAKQLNETFLKNVAGVFTRQNIFRVDLDAAARMARANPWVKEVRIHRNLPNRISMVFVERTPRAVIDTGGSRFLMDREGTVIERIARDGASDWQQLPVIAIKDGRATPGEPIAGEALQEALMLLDEIEARGGWRLADITIRANSLETLSVVYGGCEFKMGGGNYEKKLRRLAEVMADVKQRNLNIAYVDLRPERQAAVGVVQDKAKTAPSKPAKAKPKSVRKRR